LSVCRRPIRGVVFSGVGEGEFYVSIYGREFRRVLGLVPYPGTLNVRVIEDDLEEYKRCIAAVKPKIVPPPRLEGVKLAHVKAYPSIIGGIKAWIVRPDITVYKEDVAEFVSDKYLRGALNLEDGDIVEFEVLESWEE